MPVTKTHAQLRAGHSDWPTRDIDIGGSETREKTWQDPGRSTAGAPVGVSGLAGCSLTRLKYDDNGLYPSQLPR